MDIFSKKGMNMRYDGIVKHLLSNRRILSILLQGCIREFSGLSVEAIFDGCFLTSGDSGGASSGVKAGDYVLGIGTEITDFIHRLLEMDLCFHIREPEAVDSHSWQFVNVEFQNRKPRKKSLLKRAICYISAIIYTQCSRIIRKSHYEDLQKVTSIWICPCECENSVNNYNLAEIGRIGHFRAPLDTYDAMRIVVVCFNPNSERDSLPMLGMLQTLFSDTLSPEQKKRILKRDYSIELDEKEMGEMNAFSDYFVRLGRKKGRQEEKKELRDKMLSSLKELVVSSAREINAVFLITTGVVSLEDVEVVLTQGEYQAVVKQLGL